MTAPVMPEPDGGWRSRRARRKAERAWARDLDTVSKARAAGQRAADRKAGRAEEPLTWPMRILAALVAAVVLSVAAVIAAVVVGAGVGFYDAHLTNKNISFAALGIQTPLNLPTFTPLATEGLVWASTLLAIVMVLLGRTATLWTRSMWAFASVAAFVGSWFGINDEHDLFGGVLRGCLSLAGPYLVHLFILWCRHLRSGRTLAQARIDVEIRWRSIGRVLVAVLLVGARHVRHPTIAACAVGYWLGIPGWDYRAAWQAASIGYRMRVQERLDTAAAKTTDRPSAASPCDAPAAALIAAETTAPQPPVVTDETLAAGAVATAERPAFSEAEIDDLIAKMNGDSAAWGIWADQQKPAADGDARPAADTDGKTRPAAHGKASGPRPEPTTKAAEADTQGGRQKRSRTLRPRGVRRPRRPVAGASQVAGVDVSDILPAARKVAAELGDKLTRDALLERLRGQGLTVGGQRKKAVYDAVKAEREKGSTGE